MGVKSKLVLLFAIIFMPFISLAQDMVSSGSNDGLQKSILYNIASFTDIRDKKLSDVAVKLPGVSISPLTYNGMTVTKVLINGIDMMSSDYSSVWAMKPEDVESIEITENYVYEKIMRGIEYSNKVSFNIVLKDIAKSKWSGSVKGGLGATPLLYSGEAQALNIDSQTQTTILLKADNTGLDFSGDISIPSPYYSTTLNGISFLTIAPTLAPLSTQRTRINNSLFGSINNTLHINDDLQLSMQLSVHTDKLTASNEGVTSYFMSEGSSLDMEKGDYAIKKQRDLVSKIGILSNSSKHYLNNIFQFIISDNYGNNEITGSYPSNQTMKTGPVSISNTLAYKKAFGHSILSVDMVTSWDSREQELEVTRLPMDLHQEIATDGFYSNLSASYKFVIGKFSVSAKAGNIYKQQNLNSILSPIDQELVDATGMTELNNDSRVSYLNFNTDIAATYITDKLQLEIKTPLNYFNYSFRDNSTTDGKTTNKFYFQPSINGKYQISDNLSISASVVTTNTGLVTSRLYSGIVMTNFQTFSQGNVNSKSDMTVTSTVSASYRYPKSSLFINGSFKRATKNQALLYVSSFTENYKLTGYIPVDAPFNTYTNDATFDISKGIKSLKGKIGLTFSYNDTQASMYRNGTITPYTSDKYIIGVNINGKLIEWLNTIYKITYTNTNIIMGSNTSASSVSNGIVQSLELIFSPWQKFNFSFLGEHYMNQLSADQFKNLVMIDFKAEYKINDRWDLIASITNLLNQTKYDYKQISSYGASSSYTSYLIRPRNLLLSAFFKF